MRVFVSLWLILFNKKFIEFVLAFVLRTPIASLFSYSNGGRFVLQTALWVRLLRGSAELDM